MTQNFLGQMGNDNDKESNCDWQIWYDLLYLSIPRQSLVCDVTFIGRWCAIHWCVTWHSLVRDVTFIGMWCDGHWYMTWGSLICDIKHDIDVVRYTWIGNWSAIIFWVWCSAPLNAHKIVKGILKLEDLQNFCVTHILHKSDVMINMHLQLHEYWNMIYTIKVVSLA